MEMHYTAGVSLIHRFSCWEVGDGEMTDKWIPGLDTNLKTRCGSKLNFVIVVAEFLDSTTQNCNIEKVINNFPTSMSDNILKRRIFLDIN